MPKFYIIITQTIFRLEFFGGLGVPRLLRLCVQSLHEIPLIQASHHWCLLNYECSELFNTVNCTHAVLGHMKFTGPIR